MTQPPVVLLHGCGGSPEQAFIETGWLEAFRDTGREVHSLRLPGHGRDDPSHAPAEYADMAADLLSDLPSRVNDLVGFSLGAKLALDIAIRWPERVGRMVLGGIGDNAFAPESVGEAVAIALEHGPGPDTPPPVHAFLATWDPALNDPLAIAAILRRPPNPVFTVEQVAGIAAPVVVMNGANDFVATIGTRLVDALGCGQALLPGVGHFDLTAQPAFRNFAVQSLGD